MDDSSEAGVCLVVASCEATELFEALEAVLDEMAPFIHVLIVRDGHFAISFGGNDGEGAALVQGRAQGIVVEGLVGKKCCEFNAINQRIDADAVMALAGKKDKADEIAECVDEGNDLGCQSTA